jgi:hypothetical protein
LQRIYSRLRVVLVCPCISSLKLELFSHIDADILALKGIERGGSLANSFPQKLLITCGKVWD